MFIIALNGPPRSGKDTVTDYLLDHLNYPAVHLKLAMPLKRGIPSIFGLDDAEIRDEDKDKRSPALLGLTPREAYIGLSELFLKVLWGSDALGRLMKAEVDSIVTACRKGPNIPPALIVSDCGFAAELLPLLAAFDYPVNMLIVRIHRKNKSFKNDSRTYITEEALHEAAATLKYTGRFVMPHFIDVTNVEGAPDIVGDAVIQKLDDLWHIN